MRAFVRFYVWPVLVKVVRIDERASREVLFAAPPLTTTVQTGGSALRDCAPGILAGRSFQTFAISRPDPSKTRQTVY